VSSAGLLSEIPPHSPDGEVRTPTRSALQDKRLSALERTTVSIRTPVGAVLDKRMHKVVVRTTQREIQSRFIADHVEGFAKPGMR
jgi:hypothetical protein